MSSDPLPTRPVALHPDLGREDAPAKGVHASWTGETEEKPAVDRARVGEEIWPEKDRF